LQLAAVFEQQRLAVSGAAAHERKRERKKEGSRYAAGVRHELISIVYVLIEAAASA
jgi:hypothetical protein